jgi:hypothetical protein
MKCLIHLHLILVAFFEQAQKFLRSCLVKEQIPKYQSKRQGMNCDLQKIEDSRSLLLEPNASVLNFNTS